MQETTENNSQSKEEHQASLLEYFKLVDFSQQLIKSIQFNGSRAVRYEDLKNRRSIKSWSLKKHLRNTRRLNTANENLKNASSALETVQSRLTSLVQKLEVAVK